MSLAPDELRELLNQGYRYALSLCHDANRAEDLLQEGWLALLKAKGPHEKPYLFRAIRTRFLNQVKREQLVLMVPLDKAAQEQIPAQQDEWRVVADAQEVGMALQKLRPIEREALYLHAAQGYTAEEISQHTGQARGTVLSMIHRAKQKLKGWITRQREVNHG